MEPGESQQVSVVATHDLVAAGGGHGGGGGGHGGGGGGGHGGGGGGGGGKTSKHISIFIYLLLYFSFVVLPPF